MGISGRTPTTAATNYFVPTIYANRVIDSMKMELVAWDAIDSSWKTNLVKGNVLNIPVLNTVVASEVVVGTKGSALNPMNTTGVQLTIDQWWQAPVDIDYMTLEQTGVDAEGIAANAAAYSIRVKIDSTVCALFSSLGGYSTSGYGSDGQVLDDDILLYLKETLDEADVPMDNNRSLLLDPSGLVDMLKIDKFVAANYVNIGAVANGVIGKSPIYGCTVRVTNNLTAATTGSYGCMLHKQAIAGASQIDKAWTKEFEELHQRRYHAEALWGVIEARDTFGVPFFTRKS